MALSHEISVPLAAKELHNEGRMAGARGDYDRAARLLERAHELAPDWPYPIYDMAFTYLCLDRVEHAADLYAEVDRIAPDGFYTCKSSLHTVRRELDGDLPPGFSKAFAALEWLPDKERKKAILTGMTRKFPTFAPAWKELSTLLTDPAERLHALNQGLTGNPDPETRGMLILNKAILHAELGEKGEAGRLLDALLTDPATTTAARSLARELQARLSQEGAA